MRRDAHDSQYVEQVRHDLAIDPHYIRRFRHGLLQQGLPDTAALARLPEHVRSEFAKHVALHPLELIEQQDSVLDHSVKRLYATQRGDRLESVILATPTGRVSLCLSSQVGCRAGCQFCATAKMPSVTNLTAGEILDQLVQANQFLSSREQRVRNIVFMGMGEPLHNEEAVTETLDALVSPRRFNFSPAKIALSSVGVPDGMRRMAERFPKLRIALSLHSVDPDVRQTLIPMSKKHGLGELRQTLLDVVEIQGQEVMIQYLMLDGVTDREQDCERLLDWLSGIRCYINLIPYNSIDTPIQFTATPVGRREAFAERLRAAGYMTYIRYSQGSDIDAACGQLATKSADTVG